MSEVPLRVYINEQPFTLPAGSTVAAALAVFDPALGSGTSPTVTDGRGIALPLDAALSGGSILRVLYRGRSAIEGDASA